MAEKDVYETVVLERRWFKDPEEFNYICKQLGVDGSDLADDQIEINIDKVIFTTNEESEADDE